MVNSGTLLIVVNDLGLVEFLGEKLEGIGCQLVFRLSAIEAIEWLRDNTPLLMVLDFNLPDMNASDLITDLNQKGVVVPPFIVFTDQGDECIAIEMMKLGARDYIVKDGLFLDRMPFVIAKLCIAINNELKLRHAEEVLKATEEKYRLLFHNMTTGFALHEIILNPTGDPVDYRFLEINSEFEKLTGLRAKDIIGKTALEVLPETEQYWIEAYGKVAVTGHPDHFENYSKVFGKYYQVNAYSPKVGQFASVFLDITQRKQSENKLKLLSKTIDQSPVSVLITDKNGNIEYANSKFTEISGYSLEDVKGKNVRFLNSGKQDSDFYQLLWSTILSGNDWHGEFQNLKKNGELYWESAVISSIRNSQDEISFFVAIMEDITEKRKMVEELKDKNEELMDKNMFIQTILDNLPIGLALNKFDEGKAMYMNKRFEEIFGWTFPEITSMTGFFEKICPDEDYRNQVFGRIMMDIKSDDQSKMHWENINVTRKDGTRRIINAVNIPLFEQDTMVSTVMDITELHQIQNDLFNAKAQAEESDNLKTAFLNNISHEIRTPFNGLLGFLSLIQNNDITISERDEYISIINHSADRLMDTITDVVEISQIQAGQAKLNISETNIQELLRGLFIRFKPIAEMKGLKFKVKSHLSLQINNVLTDGIKLSTILSHLIGNAIKFTNSGSVELAFRLKEDHHQSVKGLPHPIELEFSVTDTGIGIPDEKHLKIFERFIQVDTSTTRKFEGTGLGLSIAKTYVEMLGGVIWLDSEIDKGTTFYFTLPCCCTDDEISISEIAAPAIETPSPKKGINVLVVEDDDASFVLLDIAVKLVAKEVLHAKTGIEAIEFCRNRPDIDLVLMDIKMPDMDGYEATRQIRQFSPNVIIIAQTAYALAGDHERALLAGCNSYISKPVKRVQLLELLQKYFKI